MKYLEQDTGINKRCVLIYFYSMRTGLVVIVCLLVNVRFSVSQNLVPNPSFEEYTQCPSGYGQVYAPFVTNWIDPNNSTADYFNTCAALSSGVGIPSNDFGFQNPRSGDAYAGLVLYGDSLNPLLLNPREYIQVQLLEPLVADSSYCLEFFVSASGGNAGIAYTSNIGAHFSIAPINGSIIDTLNYIPQISNDPLEVLDDTAQWMRVKGSFIAQGGEGFLTIGNFLPNSLTYVVNNTLPLSLNVAYYFIDDVSLEKCSQIGTSTIEPLTKRNALHVYPNPAQQDITVHRSSNKIALLQIVDCTGRVLEQMETESHQPVVDVSKLPNGLYFLKLKDSLTRTTSQTKFVVQH